jgi:hypothetical protein
MSRKASSTLLASFVTGAYHRDVVLCIYISLVIAVGCRTGPFLGKSVQQICANRRSNREFVLKRGKHGDLRSDFTKRQKCAASFSPVAKSLTSRDVSRPLRELYESYSNFILHTKHMEAGSLKVSHRERWKRLTSSTIR